MPPASGLRGQGTSPGSPAGFLGLSGWGKRPPLLLLWSRRSPATYLSWSSWPPSYAPRAYAAWRGLWRVGDQPRSSAGSLGPSGWGRRPLLLSCSLGPRGHCLSCSLPASLLCPQDQPGPEGTSEGIGPGLRAGQTSPASWAGETLGALRPDPSP